MKSLQRWSVRFSLLSGAIASMLWGMTSSVLALPQSQIIQKLQEVPVFTVANEKGVPLVARRENNSSVARVFMSQKEATEYVTQLKKEKPKLGKKAQIQITSLGRVYQIDKEYDGKSNDLDFTFVPMKEQVKSAISLLQKQGKEVNKFPGVPVFIARQNEGYLSAKGANGKQILPIFFEKDQLQSRINQLKKDNPQKAKSVTIEVKSLESVLQTLENNENEVLKKIVFYPSQESIEFIQQQIQKNSPQSN